MHHMIVVIAELISKSTLAREHFPKYQISKQGHRHL